MRNISLILILILLPCTAYAAPAVHVNVPWSSSFGSTAQTITYDGMDENIVDNLYVLENQALSAYLNTTANHPGGTGSMGYDIPIMDGVDGSQGESLGIDFVSAQPNLWIRFYVKYAAGFTWSEVDWHKFIYLGTGAGYNNTVLGLNSSDRMRVYSFDGSYPNNTAQSANTGFESIWGDGTTTADGSWHCLEFHIKMDTSGANGVAEFWLDGTLKYSDTTVDFSGGNATARQGWTLWRFNTNQSNPGNGGGGSHIYYDDISISNTGYIGPISGGGGDSTAPAVTISTANPSSITSNSLSISGTASDAVGVTACKYSIGTPPTSSTGSLLTGTTSWSGTATGFSSGSNTLYLGCSDAGNNWGSSSISVLYSPPTALASTLFTERFENTSFVARGWMDDGIPSSVATTGCQEGSGCAAFNFDNGDANPNEMPAGAMRRKFTASDGVYISAWVKLSSNWVGSGQPYHPHVFYLMTDADADDWQGPYGSPSTAYMEVLNATPQIGFQDGANINSSYIGQSLYGVTETRAAHGCNGWNDYHTWEVQDCYQDGVWVNGRMTRASSGISLNAWHHFEAYYQMNSIVNSVAQSDGIMRLWVDGVLLKDFSDLILRTNTRANMKWNKLLIAPYIGDGSPAVQSITIDNLVVMDAAPTTPLVGILHSGISASGVTFR